MAPKKKAAAADQAESSRRRLPKAIGPLPHTPAYYGLPIERNEFKERLAIFSKRGVTVTRFVDGKALEALGVWDDIERLFHSIS